MTITIKKIAVNDGREDIVIDFHNDSNGNDLKIQMTQEDAATLACHIKEILSVNG